MRYFKVTLVPVIKVVLFIVAPAMMAWAESSLDSNTYAPAYDSALHMLVKQRYKDASSCLGMHLAKNPSDNDALYLSFAVEQTRILDYESYVVENKQYQRFADSLRIIFEHRLHGLQGHDSIKCLFYLANVFGGISIMQAKTGNWFDAAKNAVRSVTLLKQVRNAVPEFYAAYLGLGVFQYYLRNSFKWIPFVNDADDDGVTTIEIALKAEFPYNYAAKNSLCWILIEQDQYQRADSLAKTVLQDVPDNTIFLRIRMMIALWTQQYEAALRIAELFNRLTMKRQPINWADIIVGQMVVAQCNKEAGNMVEMKKAIAFILAQPIPKAYTAIPHVKKYMKQIRELDQQYRNVKSGE